VEATNTVGACGSMTILMYMFDNKLHAEEWSSYSQKEKERIME
jgi:hypothetical protein